MRNVIPSMLAIVTVALMLAAADRMSDVMNEDGVRAVFASLLEDAQGGMSSFEEAVFIIRMPTGRIAFVRWPRATFANEARWMGRFPPGVIAIAHTHPNWMPNPSNVDILTAARAGIAVYVITRYK